MKIIDDLEFGRVGDRLLLATFYQAAGKAEQPRPVIIWIHGGAWMGGSRHNHADLCRAIVAAGIHCLAISYRLSGEAIFPAAIEDCKCAVRFLRAHAGQFSIRADAIGAWGDSAGGHLATLLGTSAYEAALEGTGGWPDQSSAIQAVCDWYGPTDFLRMSAFPSDIDHDAADSPESRLIGASIQQQPELAQRANPIRYISATTPPMYIAHGTADRIVPLNQSELLHAALLANDSKVVFEAIDGAGHGGPEFVADSPLTQRCIAFFQQHLSA